MVEAGEGENKMNPKEKFLEECITLVGEFEDKTGVAIISINLERTNLSSIGAIVDDSAITKIKLEMK